MINFKFRGVMPAVTNYVKSKPLIEVAAEVFCYGVLTPLAFGGILFFVIMMVTGNVDFNQGFGIYG